MIAKFLKVITKSKLARNMAYSYQINNSFWCYHKLNIGATMLYKEYKNQTEKKK